MASVTSLPGGKKAVQFLDAAELRRTIRLGKMSVKQAERVGERLEYVVAAVESRSMLDSDTARWLAEISDSLHAKLAGFGLCEARKAAAPEEPPATVGSFVDEYLKLRGDVKPATHAHLKRAGDKLKAFLGADRPLDAVTALDAESFRRHLRSTSAENTTRRMVSRARQFFAAAVSGRRIAENPFAHLKGLNVRAVKERQAFIDRDATQTLLDAAPSAEWRAIIALARFGGIRVPSELYPLKWTDIDWSAGVVNVESPKTEHCGKGRRTTPLFPELRAVLSEAFDAAEPGAVYVLHRYRSKSQNLRQGLKRIIAKAKLTEWPKLFVNLRASRATELVEHFPGHVAAAWLGHTEAVANEHYRQVTPEHMARAASKPTGVCSALKSALQGALQSGPESTGKMRQSENAKEMSADAAHEKGREFPVHSTACVTLPAAVNKRQATRLGLEPRMREPKSLVLPLHYRVVVAGRRPRFGGKFNRG